MTPFRASVLLRTVNFLIYLWTLRQLQPQISPSFHFMPLAYAFGAYTLVIAALALWRRHLPPRAHAFCLSADVLLIHAAAHVSATGGFDATLAVLVPAAYGALSIGGSLGAAAPLLAAIGMLLHSLSPSASEIRGMPLYLPALFVIAAFLKTPAATHSTGSAHDAGERRKALLFNEFINHILFQVREYLTSITTTSEHIARTAQEPSIRDLGGKLQRMIVELNGKVGRMLSTVQSYTTGRRKAGAQEFEIKDLIEECLSHVRNAHPSETVATIDCDAHMGPLTWDRDILTTVIHAVMTNAFEATEGKFEEGRVQITVQGAGDALHIFIADNGGGIAPEEQGQVFQPLYTTKSLRGNIGLGLSMSRRILERSGATIDLKSEKGTTTLRLTVPFSPTLPIIRNAESTWSSRRQSI